MEKKPTRAKNKPAAKDKSRAATFQVERILESVSDSFVALDTNWIYTYVNEKAAQTFGRTREQLIGKHIWTEFPEGIDQPFYKAYYKAMETQQPIFLEEYYPPYDRWFENRIYPSKDGLSIFFHDITDHKRAELSLLEAEEKYRSIFENAVEGIFQSTLQGRFIAVNPAMARIYGYASPQEMISSITDINRQIHADPQKRTEFIALLNSKGFVEKFEARNLRKDGSVFWTKTNARAVRDANGKILYYEGFVTNITERKRADVELRLSEERFSNAFKVSPAGITITRIADGKFIDVNDSFLRMFEFSREEVIGHTSTELNMWTQEERKKLIQHQLESGGLHDFELQARSKSGRIVNILFSSKPMELEGETCHITTMIDITDHKQAEKALRESEERFRRALENIPDVVVIYDRDLRIQYINAATLKVTGRPTSDFIGRREEEIWPPEVYEVYLPTLREAFETRAIRSVETVLLIPQGGSRTLSITCVPVINEEGQVREVLGITHDFTERKQADEKIRRHLNQLTALNKSALQLQRLHSPQILAGEIIKSLEMILNYTYGAVLLIDESGERLIPFALSAQKQGASFEEQDKRYVESADIRVGKGITGWVAQSGQSIRLGDVRQDERYFGIREDIRSELCVPLKAGERVIGVINIESTQTDDYSETDERVLETVAAQVSIAIQNSQLFEQVQKQTAELERRVLERTTQFQNANKELESFSYSVSHDLRAPLRAISGFAEIIARRHRADLNEEGQHYFDNIIQASERMGHLIEDLLTYSRLGQTGLRLEPISLAGVLADLAKDLKGHLDELHGTISVAGGLPDVPGDKTLLSQIFTNLLENAVAYRKAEIPPQINVTCQLEGNHVIVSVKDNGIGIPAEYQDKIFNIFQRLHSEEEYAGTGIGLATVKKSVELLGGNVWVESKVGEGSTFVVKLNRGT